MVKKPLHRPDLWAGAVMIVVLMGTALVSPLYPIYRSAWQLTASQVSQLYVIYMLGALCALLLFGRLSDQIGYRKVVIAGLILGLIGTLLSMTASGFYSFGFARFLVGIAGSLTTSAGALAVIKLASEERRSNAPVLASLMVSGGFAVGPILGGAFGQWSSAPLVMAHIPSLVLILGAFLVAWRLPKDAGRGGFSYLSLLPRLSWTDRAQSTRLALTCCLPFLGFGIFGLYASLAPMLIRNFTGMEGPMISGAYIGIFLIGTAIAQFFGRRFAPRKSAMTALILMSMGNAIMWVNLTASSVVLFGVGVCIAAIGHGLCLLSSTVILNSIARADNRGALTATYWAIGYSGSILPMLILGWASDVWGLEAAVSGFCAIAICLCLGVAALISRVKSH